MTMTNPIESFRRTLLDGITRLRSVAGTSPDREYERVLAFVNALPAPVDYAVTNSVHLPLPGLRTVSFGQAAPRPPTIHEEAARAYLSQVGAQSTYTRQCNCLQSFYPPDAPRPPPKCTDEEIANGTCKP